MSEGSEKQSNLPTIEAAIGRKFSNSNQRLTKYKRCEPDNHASDCRSSAKGLDRRRCRSGVCGEAPSSSFSSETGILESITAHLTNLEAGQREGGLTCLSFRCLSSYLIFPPVPVTSKLRVGFAWE